MQNSPISRNSTPPLDDFDDNPNGTLKTLASQKRKNDFKNTFRPHARTLSLNRSIKATPVIDLTKIQKVTTEYEDDVYDPFQDTVFFKLTLDQSHYYLWGSFYSFRSQRQWSSS